MGRKLRLFGLLLLVATAWIAGCQAEPATPTPAVSPLAAPEGTTASSPPATPAPEDVTSALPTPQGSPLAQPAPLEGPRFSIDEPLREDDTEVRGTGPEGLPIVIADVTLMGEVLGAGKIGSDGRFSISVSPPLVANHRIAIMLDVQTGEIQYTEELLQQLEAFKGDNAIVIPHIGALYDAASVQP